jgi:Rod binding domain-containing protein
MDNPVIQPWAMSQKIPVNGANNVKNGPDVASQFEQVLLRQYLSQVRAAGASLNPETASPSTGYLQMADDHLASVIAASGGLGLGNSLRRWLKATEAYQVNVDPVLPANPR